MKQEKPGNTVFKAFPRMKVSLFDAECKPASNGIAFIGIILQKKVIAEFLFHRASSIPLASH